MPTTAPLQAPGVSAPPAPTPPGVPVVVIPQDGGAAGSVAAVAELQARINSLQQTLGGLRAQRTVLRRQLARTSSDGVAHAQLEVTQANLETQIAETEMNLAGARAELSARQGTDGQTIVPPRFPGPFRRQVDPDMVIGLSFVLILAALLPASIAFARRIWRGRPAPVARPFDDPSAQRLERLEHAVDAIAIEIERISEGQRFVTKVLAERPVAQPVHAAPVEQGMAEAAPIRALGAGPMEPIRMPERQAVKQSVTPH